MSATSSLPAMAAPGTSMAGVVAVVTGAARGIGRSIAERFAAEGARVACIDVSSHRIEAAVAEMRAGGPDVHAYVADVGRRADVHAVMSRIESDLGGPISVLLNNAVWARYQPIEEIDEETLERMLAVGLKGMVWTTQAVAEQMKRGARARSSTSARRRPFSRS